MYKIIIDWGTVDNSIAYKNLLICLEMGYFDKANAKTISKRIETDYPKIKVKYRHVE